MAMNGSIDGIALMVDCVSYLISILVLGTHLLISISTVDAISDDGRADMVSYRWSRVEEL